MSIASEIQRLQGDSSAIASAISAKGVTVPSGSGFDDYASLIASIPTGGGGATLQSKTASPSTSQQVVTADSGYDGLSQVTISAVTSAIDSNIVAGNIKSGVSILGVTGTYSGGGESVDPELPSGYTRKSYIYSNGSAFIKTGITGAANWIITVQADAGQTAKFFIGQGSSSGQYFGILSSGNIGVSTNSAQYVTGVSASSKFNAAILFGRDRLAATINQYGLYRNGSVTRTGEYALLALSSAGGSGLAAKLWVADCWQGTEMVFHGVPCKRDLDNKVGLYDTVSKSFFPSDSSTDFTSD